MSSPAEAATRLHPTAIIDPKAELAEGVEVGAYAVIGPRVRIGADSVIGPHVYIQQDTDLGPECVVAKGAALGGDPQDVKYEGEQTQLIVGAGTLIRECATLHRGTRSSGATKVGERCFIMAYAHVSHDSRIANNVVISNAVQMGGHAVIEEYATIGGLVAIHQYVRIGAYAFIGGASRVPKDVPPFTMAAGVPIKLFGLNAVGLERRGFSKDARSELKRAYRLLFGAKYNVREGIKEIRSRGPACAEVERLIAFIESSERGVTV